MGIPWTLQRYIFREMGKSFLLTAAALTGVLGLGGGVMNMLKAGDVTPSQLFRLLSLVIPLAAALTLPIAALFSATSTYGRLSADNEFVACRSSGINMHVLLLPTVVLSLFSACVTFGLVNFLVPRMVSNLESVVSADLNTFIQQRLEGPRGLTFDNRFRIHAEQCTVDPARPDELFLERVTFVEIDGQDWVRLGTVRSLRFLLRREGSRVLVSGVMHGTSFYDRKLDQFLEEETQDFPANEINSPMSMEIKFLNLPELFHYRAHTGEWFEVQDEMERLRRAVGKWMIYDDLWAKWQRDKSFELKDDNVRFVVHAESARRVPREGGVILSEVTIDEFRGSERRWITASRATVEVVPDAASDEATIRLVLRSASLSDGKQRLEKDKTILGPVPMPAAMVQSIKRIPDHELTEPRSDTEGDPLAARRAKVRDTWDDTRRRIDSTIHQRLAFSASVLVLVILGAVMGTVMRGSHVLTAFGISFVPSLIVIIAIVAGKQMSQNAGTHVLGILMIWSGIALVALLDVWALKRALRR